MKKRTKKILSMILALSMVFGMNTFALGDEIADKASEAEAWVTADPDVTAPKAELVVASENTGYMYDENGNVITTITFESNGSKKNPQDSVAVIKNVTDPVSWNNFYGRDLMNTIISYGSTDDEFLDFGKKSRVSDNWHYPKNSEGKRTTPENILLSSIPQQFRVLTVDKEKKIYLLVCYYMRDERGVYCAYVKGHDSYAGADLAPLPRIGSIDNISDQEKRNLLCRVENTPVEIWDGRKIAFDRDGYYTATKNKKEALVIRTALVQYSGNTVTELYGTRVNKVKFSKKEMKKASVSTRNSTVKIKAKYLDDNGKEQTVEIGKSPNPDPYDIESPLLTQDFFESELLGPLPYFTFTVKTDKKLKKYKKAINKALKGQKFEFGIMQKECFVQDPTDPTTGAIYEEYVTNGKGSHWSKDAGTGEIKVFPASYNDAEKALEDKIERYFREDQPGAIVSRNMDAAKGINLEGLIITKFDGKKASIYQELPIYKKGRAKGTAKKKLKNGRDFELKEGTLAGGEKVKVLELKNNYGYVYSVPYEYEYYGKKFVDTAQNDLSAFGFKWAFRVSPKNKKAFRVGIYADKDVGFVFGSK